MNTKFYYSSAFIGIVSIALLIGASGQEERRRGPVVRQADRIMIESDNPRALFNFFSQILQLPVAWPLAEYPKYTSGSVSTGDVTLEVYGYGVEDKPGGKARFSGLAFEPYPLEDALRELRIIGIPFQPPQAHESALPDGSRGTAWTTVALPSLSTPLFPVTLYEYSPLFLKVDVRRRQMGNRLLLDSGGPLGILSMQAILLESVDTHQYESEWTRLLGNPKPDGTWRPVKGPAIRMVRGPKYGIQRIILKVKSLDRAAAFLRERKLAGPADTGEIFINTSAVQGLTISLVEK